MCMLCVLLEVMAVRLEKLRKSHKMKTLKVRVSCRHSSDKFKIVSCLSFGKLISSVVEGRLKGGSGRGDENFGR